jgi:hypothetical protein
MRLLSLPAGLAAPLVAAAPAAARPIDHDVPAAFADVLPGVVAKTTVPVLLPDRMPYDGELFAMGTKRTERRILVRMANQAIRAERR